MSSGIKLHKNSIKQNLEDLVEITRDKNTDPECILPSYGYSGGNLDLMPKQAGHSLGSGVNINDLDNKNIFTSVLGEIPPLMEKWTRPRLNYSFVRRVTGTTQRYYYYFATTNTTIYLYRATSLNGTYSAIASSNIASPKFLYIFLVGGGGGGGGGGWGLFWTYKGASGGSGGGLLLTTIPVAPRRSNFSTRDVTTDYCISIFRGGNGNPGGGIDDAGRDGEDGTDSIIYYPNGSIYCTAVKGRGGYMGNKTPAYSQSSMNTLWYANGGYGGGTASNGGSVSKKTSQTVFGEKMSVLWGGDYFSTSGPGNGHNAKISGGGGGASLGRGGDGKVPLKTPPNTPYGYQGAGGGGGGADGFYYSQGYPGGPGVFIAFY